MVNVKPLAQIQANYQSAAAVIPARYTAGIQATTTWQANSIASEPLYEAKIQASIAAKARVKGLNAVSESAWQSAALNVGSVRIGTGVSTAGPKYIAKFGPYATALSSVTLPAKTADPVANVTNRVIPIVKALVAAKAAK